MMPQLFLEEQLIPKKLAEMIVRQKSMSRKLLDEVPAPDIILNEAEAADFQKICKKLIELNQLHRYKIHIITGSIVYAHTLQRQRDVIRTLPKSRTKRQRKYWINTSRELELIWLDFGLTPDDFEQMGIEWPTHNRP